MDISAEPYTIPFGRAELRREGSDITVVASLLMLHRVLLAAEELQREEDLSVEVIDPRTLVPLDVDTISRSVEKTRTLVVVEECQPLGSWGNEVIASVCEKVHGEIKSKRIGTTPTPIPYAVSLENRVIPDIERIKRGIVKVLREVRS